MKHIGKMFTHKRSSHSGLVSLSLLLILLATSSCGGGEGTYLAGGGIGGTGVTSVGSISAFGSIWVNGVEYETSNANITVNGIAATQAALTRGMVVTVEGTVNADGVSGNADIVTYRRDISGTVTDVDPDNKTITILGQTITWDDETYSDDNEPGVWEHPAIGDYVEISGMPTADGWLARAINQHPPEDEDEISGIVTNLDTDNRTMWINNLEIQYQPHMGADLQEGDYIKVSGQLLGNVFAAAELEIHHLELPDDEEMEVEGIIAGYNPDTKMLTILGTGGRYTIDAAGVVFERGTEADLISGRRIEVEGYVQNGILNAEEIEFKGVRGEQEDP